MIPWPRPATLSILLNATTGSASIGPSTGAMIDASMA